MTTDPNSLHEVGTAALRALVLEMIDANAIALGSNDATEPTWETEARGNALQTVRALLHSMLEATNNSPSPEWFTWIVAFKVDKMLIADGFDLTTERAERMLANDLDYAYGHEINARTLVAPNAERVATTQGYKSAADRDARKAG